MPDGQKFGPADTATLNQWVAEGRLAPNSMLEDASSGARVLASQVPGLLFPGSAPMGAPGGAPQMAPPSNDPYANPQPPMGGPGPGPGFQQPPGYSPYQRPMGAASMEEAQKKVTMAWVFGSIGLLCCPVVFSVLGIVFANQAVNMGHPGAQNARTYCIVTLIVGMIIGVIVRFSMR